MKHFNILAATAAALLLVLSGCRTSKSATTPSTPAAPASTTTQALLNDHLNAIAAATGAWTTMKASGSISIGGTTSFSSGVQVRMVRDKALYISLRPLLGIEAGRLIVRDDSLFVLDKLHKQYIAEKVSVLTAGVPATVGMVQDMFLGRPFVVGEGSVNPSRKTKVTLTASGDHFVLAPTSQPRDFAYTFGCNKANQVTSLDVKVTGVTLGSNNATDGSAYSMTYSDIRRTLAGNIAHALRFITDVNGKKLKLSLDYSGISWNDDVDTSFNIPANYKRISASSLTSLFGAP